MKQHSLPQAAAARRAVAVRMCRKTRPILSVLVEASDVSNELSVCEDTRAVR